MKIEGGCLCGKVRYSGEAEPIFAGRVPLHELPKGVGSAFNVVVARAKARDKRPGPAEDVHGRGDTGKATYRRFCPDCASPIIDEAEIMPDVIMIPAGTLDDPSWVKPTMQIYCDSAQPWVKLEGDIEELPEDAGPRLTRVEGGLLRACGFKKRRSRSGLAQRRGGEEDHDFGDLLKRAEHVAQVLAVRYAALHDSAVAATAPAATPIAIRPCSGPSAMAPIAAPISSPAMLVAGRGRPALAPRPSPRAGGSTDIAIGNNARDTACAATNASAAKITSPICASAAEQDLN